MFDRLEFMIKLRYAELLREAKTARLIVVTKAQLFTRVAQVSDNLTYDPFDSTSANSSVQRKSAISSPDDSELNEAAKGDIRAEMIADDDLSEVFFFKKSVF